MPENKTGLLFLFLNIMFWLLLQNKKNFGLHFLRNREILIRK